LTLAHRHPAQTDSSTRHLTASFCQTASIGPTTSRSVILLGLHDARNSKTPTPVAGPSSSKITTTNPFDALMSLGRCSDVEWESGTDSDDNYESDNSGYTPAKRKGKGLSLMTPKPVRKCLGRPSKLPARQQQKNESPSATFGDNDEIPTKLLGLAEALLPKAITDCMEKHFGCLYSKVDNLKAEIATLMTTSGGE
jgi:hypothetical protein